MDKKVAETLRILADNVRKMRGKMSQGALAAKAGVSRSTVYNIERECGCSLENLARVAAALDVAPGQLLEAERQTSVVDLLRSVIKEELRAKS